MLTRDHTVLPATHTIVHKWNESWLPLHPICRASLRFGQYLFPIPWRVRGWVSLDGWLHTEVVYLPEDGHHFQVLTRPDIEKLCYCSHCHYFYAKSKYWLLCFAYVCRYVAAS